MRTERLRARRHREPLLSDGTLATVGMRVRSNEGLSTETYVGEVIEAPADIEGVVVSNCIRVQPDHGGHTVASAAFLWDREES